MKNDETVFMKIAIEGCAVVVWNNEDYIWQEQKKLGDNNVSEEVPDDPEPLINTIHKTLENIRKIRKLRKKNIQYFED